MEKISITLMVSCFITCFGSSMLYGYNIAVFNGPKEHVECFLTKWLTERPHCGNITDTGVDPEKAMAMEHKIGFYYSLVNTVWIIFGAIGAFSTGAISNYFGRRNGLVFNNIFVIVGAIICAPSVSLEMPILLYVGRAFIGFNCGVTIGLASIYLTEMAPRSLRGAIGACHQLAVTIGILVAFTCSGLEQLMNRPNLWIVAQALTGVPAVLSLLVLPFCPESPRYLFINRGQKDKASKALRRLYPHDDPQKHIEEMQKEMETSKKDAENASSFRFTQLFTQPDLRMPVAIAVGIQIMQQLSGINAVMSYSTSMMEVAGISPTAMPFANIGISFFNVLCTVIALPLLEKFGRRTLLLVPSGIMATSLIVLCVSTAIVNGSDTEKMKQGGSVVFMIFLYVYTAGFAFGLGTIPGLIVAEIFRQEPRSAAYSLSQGVQWISALIVSTTFVNLKLLIKGYVFLIYLCIVLPFLIFFAICMPETKNRSFDDIANDLAFIRLCRRGQEEQVIEDSPADKFASSNMSLLKDKHEIRSETNGAERV